eukprot:6205599-Pleurochrysis_carterae.AAC.1
MCSPQTSFERLVSGDNFSRQRFLPRAPLGAVADWIRSGLRIFDDTGRQLTTWRVGSCLVRYRPRMHC